MLWIIAQSAKNRPIWAHWHPGRFFRSFNDKYDSWGEVGVDKYNPGLFYFRSFQTQILKEKTVGFSGIRTRIVGQVGKHAYHLITTTAE